MTRLPFTHVLYRKTLVFKITLKCEKFIHLQQINVANKDKSKIGFMLSFIASSHIADNQTNGLTSRHPTKNETELNP